MTYDYTIVGAGLYGCTFAHQAAMRGARCLVLERELRPGGNAQTTNVGGIVRHDFGPHLFRTNSEKLWRYVNKLTPFNDYAHRVRAVDYANRSLAVPFCMHTFCGIWGWMTPAAAKQKIAAETSAYQYREPRNLEEQALKSVGPVVYEALIKDYTEKQWMRSCSQLPASILKRIPIRFDWDDRYSTHKFQGVPFHGYSDLVECMLMSDKIDARYGAAWDGEQYGTLVWSGPLDALFGHDEGHLEYRGLRFDHEQRDVPDFQGMAQVNFTSHDKPYTRVIEHSHFYGGPRACSTIITKEVPISWRPGDRPYYPINDEVNDALALRYKRRAAQRSNTIVGGRLGCYQYLDMDQVIGMAINDASAG